MQARLHQIAHFSKHEQTNTSDPSKILSPRITKLIRLIHQSYTEGLQVQEYAEQVDLNYRYASNAIKELFGYSIKEYIARLRIAYARSNLIRTKDSITEIAYESGFQSMSRFYEWFDRICQTTPNDYRRNYKNL